MKADKRSQLLASLRGQKVVIPDLRTIQADWPEAVSPYREAMVEVTNTTLESLVTDKLKLAKLKMADFALLGSMWYPYAGFQELRIVTIFLIWLFIWDDEIDEPPGSMNTKFDAAQAFRRDTLDFIEYTLDLSAPDVPPVPPNPIIKGFQPISDALCVAYTVEQRQEFFGEMQFYIKMCELEQEVRLTGRTPTMEEYWQWRMGTGAVGACTAMIEYASKCRVPSSIKRSPALKELWDQTVINVWLGNDMLSMKKEIALGSVESFIPLACAIGNIDAQIAMDTAMELMKITNDRFEAAAVKLLSKSSNDPVTERTVRMFVDGCRYQCTGSFDWSILTVRYGLRDLVQEDGRIPIVL